MAEQLFNFITLRPPELILKSKLKLRYIKDPRSPAQAKFRTALVQKPNIAQKVIFAKDYLKFKWESPKTGIKLDLPNLFFYSREHYFFLGMDGLAKLMRETVKPIKKDSSGDIVEGVTVSELISLLSQKAFWINEEFFTGNMNQKEKKQLALFISAIWNSLYAMAVLATVQQTETNYITDSLRVLYVLLLITHLKTTGHEYWSFDYFFDDYEVLIPENLF